MHKLVQWAADPALRRTAPVMTPDIAQALGRVLGEFAPGIYPTFNDTLANVYLGNAGIDTLKHLDARSDAAFGRPTKRD